MPPRRREKTVQCAVNITSCFYPVLSKRKRKHIDEKVLHVENRSALVNDLFLIPRWVNPSDCVDMDCDGRRQLLITDIDGSFSGGKAGDTIIPKAEYEWDGNPRFGLGKSHHVFVYLIRNRTEEKIEDKAD